MISSQVKSCWGIHQSRINKASEALALCTVTQRDSSHLNRQAKSIDYFYIDSLIFYGPSALHLQGRQHRLSKYTKTSFKTSEILRSCFDLITAMVKQTRRCLQETKHTLTKSAMICFHVFISAEDRVAFCLRTVCFSFIKRIHRYLFQGLTHLPPCHLLLTMFMLLSTTLISKTKPTTYFSIS